MTEHLSDLALDALALEADADHPHLADCEACRARLEAFRRARRQAQADPRFRALQAALPTAAPRRGGWLSLGLAVVVAASLTAVLLPRLHRGHATRIKGGARLALLPLDGKGPDFHPGQKVVLEVGGAGHAYGLVLARDAKGRLSQVWPSSGGRSGRIPPGAAARLRPAFVVTPGSLHLVALFSDAPLLANEVISDWRRSGGRAPPVLGGEAARAEADLEVEAGP